MENGMKNFDEATLQYIRTNSLAGVRGGVRPRDFLDIWMVIVDDRIFARSWNLSERSWFTAFLQEGAGAIRCGDRVVEVQGRQIAGDDPLQARISAAYLEKYTSEHSRPYAEGIIRPPHLEATMEFIPA
jgi:hypothetical protein